MFIKSFFWSMLGLGSITAVAAPMGIPLPGDRMFPESVTSTKDGALYVGSIGSGGVYRIAPHSSTAEIWIKPGAFGSRSIFGVLADERSNTLWACSDDLSFMGVAVMGSEPGSALKAFDLKTGEGLKSFALPGEHAFCNDMAVGRDGAVYVTDTAASQILRLAPRGKRLEVWLTDPMLQPPPRSGGLDGIAFGEDGKLYFGSNGQGELYRVDVKQGKASSLVKLDLSRPLRLPDTLRPIGHGRFVLVENSGRVSTVMIKNRLAMVTTLKEGFDTPTGAALAGATVWVSEGQLGLVFDPSKKGQTPSLPFRLYPVPLTH